MILTHTLSNFFSHLNNNLLIKKGIIFFPISNKILHLLSLLLIENHIKSYRINKEKTKVIVFLNYNSNLNFEKFKIISKPSKRIYLKVKDIYSINKNFILSTNLGFLSKKQAIKFNVGGEYIAELYV